MRSAIFSMTRGYLTFLLGGCLLISGLLLVGPVAGEESGEEIRMAQAVDELPPGHPPAGGGGGLPPGAPNPMEEIMAMKARLDKDPKDLEALISLGNANMMISRVEAAAELYERALAINPDDLDTRTNLAIALKFQGKVGRSIKELKKNLKRDPKHDASLYNLGYIYHFDQKDSAEALKIWKKWLSLYPDSPAAPDIAKAVSRIEAGAAPPP